MSRQFTHKAAADQLTAHMDTDGTTDHTSLRETVRFSYRCAAGMFLLIHTPICHHFTFQVGKEKTPTLLYLQRKSSKAAGSSGSLQVFQPNKRRKFQDSSFLLRTFLDFVLVSFKLFNSSTANCVTRSDLLKVVLWEQRPSDPTLLGGVRQ